MSNGTNTSPNPGSFTLYPTMIHNPLTGIPDFKQTTGTLPGGTPHVPPHAPQVAPGTTAKSKIFPSILG